jgi:hypothetical protein
MTGGFVAVVVGKCGFGRMERKCRMEIISHRKWQALGGP